MRVALTGVSSFTGCHIAHALRASGHEVLAPLTRHAEAYASDELVGRRLAHAGVGQAALASQVPLTVVHQAPFGSEKFLQSLEDFRPEVFVNHGADIKGYRSPDFDIARSVESSLFQAADVFATLKKVGTRRMVHTGSVFEPLDGLSALSPYGQSKFLVSQEIKNLCVASGLAFSKVYIPNPIGPLENSDRMIPLFVEKWKRGERPQLSLPKAVWDHVPAPWLARVYVEECLREGTGESLRRPSAFAIPLADFVALFVREAKLAGVKLALDYDVAAKLDAPAARLNTDPCAELHSDTARAEFFKAWMHSLFAAEAFSS